MQSVLKNQNQQPLSSHANPSQYKCMSAHRREAPQEGCNSGSVSCRNAFALKMKVLQFAKKCLKLTAVILITSKTHLASEQRDQSWTYVPFVFLRRGKYKDLTG